MSIPKIINEGVWKRSNRILSLEITVSKHVYIGTSVLGSKKYKDVLRSKKFYGKSEDEVLSKVTQYLKENGYDE